MSEKKGFMENEKRFGLYLENCGHEYDGSYPWEWYIRDVSRSISEGCHLKYMGEMAVPFICKRTCPRHPFVLLWCRVSI